MIALDNKDISIFRTLIADAHYIALVSHTNADGDAVGSLLATKRIIESHTKAPIQCILPTPPPDMFSYLPGYNDILVDAYNHEHCIQTLCNADLIIALDLNKADRIDNMSKALTESQAHKVLIDHHHSPDTSLFHILFSIPEFSSTCELTYWLFTNMYGEGTIDRISATCLYSGICTDTGFFSYSCESPTVFEAAARLVAHNIDPAGIHNSISNCFSINRMKFYGFAISERLRLFPEAGMAYFYISLADQKQFGIAPPDMEGLVNYTLMMKDIKVGALLREEPNRVKISLRSKDDFDVNAFASKYWNGGGHTKAAGATSNDTFENTIKLLETNLLAEMATIC